MALDSSSGSLSPGGRFDRMEAALGRIETKLDQKVSHEEFRPLVRRVDVLEAGETPLGKVLMEQFSATQRQISDLFLHGSPQAQAAHAEVTRIAGKVATLESASESNAAVATALQKRNTMVLRIWGGIISSLSFIALAASTHLIHIGTG